MSNGSVEVWFRGEGVGVAPSKIGGARHDLGDGVYFTDLEDVAKVYAQRRAKSPDGQMVWMLSVERQSLGNVLDLTTDARWLDHMNSTKDPMLMGKSRLDYFKIRQELYAQYFEEFLKKYNINIHSYDAVIGPEYNLGGKQLCVLHKNGQPSKLSLRLRVLLKPASSVAKWVVNKATGTTTVKMDTRPTGGSAKMRFVKGVAGFAGSILFALVIGYINSKILGKIYNDIIQKSIAGFEPEIQRRLEYKKRRAFELLAVGQKAYAVVSVTIVYYYTLDPDTGWDQSAPGVDLDFVTIGKNPLNGPGEETMEHQFAQKVEKYQYLMSDEIIYPQQEIDTYKSAIAEMKWFDDALKAEVLTDSDRARLAKEKKVLEDKIIEVYGH